MSYTERLEKVQKDIRDNLYQQGKINDFIKREQLKLDRWLFDHEDEKQKH